MTRPWAALTARHSAVLAMLAVGACFTLVALAAAVATLHDTLEEQAPGLRTELHPPLSAPASRLGDRCSTCGVIERIVLTEDLNGVPLSYEFTVRMHDGSIRHGSDTGPGQWQVGDGIQLLGGGRTWSKP